jgi:hypothetical protein
MQYTYLTEAYNGTYVDTTPQNGYTLRTYPEMDTKLTLLTVPEDPALPLYSSQNFSELDVTPGNKFRVQDGILSVDKRSGIKRFFTRDGRTTTLKFLKNHTGEMTFHQLFTIIHCLLETYKKDKKWCEKALELLHRSEYNSQ